LLVAELIKVVFSAWMITGTLPEGDNIGSRLAYLINKSRKMIVLAAIYGVMNILGYVSLRNLDAGFFTIFAQCKILTTAIFSSIILRSQYSWAQWRAMVSLMLGVILFTSPVWYDLDFHGGGNAFIGTVAVLTEVILSGFASIYFEKVIKTDPDKIGIWERNFQLALGSCPIYLIFIMNNKGDVAGYLGGWTPTACILALLGAAGGLLVALSIKYGDSVLKTLATSGAIILSSILDHAFLGGPLTATMCLAGIQVIIAIANYTLDYPPTPVQRSDEVEARVHTKSDEEGSEMTRLVTHGLTTRGSSKV
jgi:UDP-sugar transporter A1/2/3